MQKRELEERYRAREADETEAAEAVAAVGRLERFLVERGEDVDRIPLHLLREHLSRLIKGGTNSQGELLALARYASVTSQEEALVHLLAIFGTAGVISSVLERVGVLAGKEALERVRRDLGEPPFGSPPEAYPGMTRRLVEKLEAALGLELCGAALAGNHHRVPRDAFALDRERFLSLGNVDAYLEELHARNVAEIERHMNEGRLWYEQRITPRVVAFVRATPEILSGVRQGNRIFVTKIPYDPDRYLTESDPRSRRHYACHCPFARAGILSDAPGVPGTWCHCSAGYEKLRFDVAFDSEHEVQVLESVLDGSERCRFALVLPEA